MKDCSFLLSYSLLGHLLRGQLDVRSLQPEGGPLGDQLWPWATSHVRSLLGSGSPSPHQPAPRPIVCNLTGDPETDPPS